MRRIVITMLINLFAMVGLASNGKILSKSEGSITFVVDEDLPPLAESPYKWYRPLNGEKLAKTIVKNNIAISFANEQNLMNLGDKDVFFQCIVKAYANHQNVTLSPDMIWLIISQGFARYINEHSEQLRDKLVKHTGKMDLIVESNQDLLSSNVDWSKLFEGFYLQIDKNTKGDIAQTMIANFTTTSPAERIASEITLMETVKSYFEYIVYYIACGIPSITLKGTPNDWQLVLDKTKKLSSYGLGEWTQSLEPILKEFIRAAEGNPKQRFWQSIVKKKKVEKLKGGGCSPEKPTQLDGWLLKLFPDENGKTLDKIPKTKNMPKDRVKVGFKYRVLNPTQGVVDKEIPMELTAGFIGAEVDTIANMVTPKIGWLVNVSKSDEDILQSLRNQDEDFGIEIRVKDVPEILAKLNHIKRLHIEFTDTVILPEWLDNITIDNFIIEGKLSEAEKEKIKTRFPTVVIL